MHYSAWTREILNNVIAIEDSTIMLFDVRRILIHLLIIVQIP